MIIIGKSKTAWYESQLNTALELGSIVIANPNERYYLIPSLNFIKKHENFVTLDEWKDTWLSNVVVITEDIINSKLLKLIQDIPKR
jgi:hypothetical protein